MYEAKINNFWTLLIHQFSKNYAQWPQAIDLNAQI